MTWMDQMDRRRELLDEEFGGRGLYPWLGSRTRTTDGETVYLGRPLEYGGYRNNSLRKSGE